MADSPTYRKALAERSSYVENVLIHHLVSSLAGELWRRDPTVPLHIFNSEVDDSGFDIVLACGDRQRYIQVKQIHLNGMARKFSVRLQFTRLPGSCVVVVHPFRQSSAERNERRRYGFTTATFQEINSLAL